MIGLGESKKISVSFYARSSSGNVQVRWKKAGESDTLRSHREAAGPVSLLMYGQLVTLLGTVTVLTLTDVRQVDEGNYTVTVISDINGVNRQSSTNILVDVTDRPSTEENMPVECTEANTVVIVGGVLGCLAALVVPTMLVVIFWRPSKTKDLPEGTKSR
ncbi:uncharacterized protein LOC135464195 [Liolophura sinensis]|uniref:uncharacterized protein LOC135464195 n=1 Tax=Liolophura sinensis TaxID=3198878 RepID=UPI0031591BA1